MKKGLVTIILLVFISITMFSLIGCSDDGNTAATNNDTISKEKKKDKIVGTRSNPVGLGETVEWKVKFYADIDDWDGLKGLANVTLNKVYENEEAINMLYFGSEALEDVEKGYKFAVADITIELVEGDDDAAYTTSFQVGSVSEEGRKSPFEYTTLAEKYEENEYTDLYPGGTVNIKQAFLVPEDGGYLVEIEENISGTKFFKDK